MLGFSDGMFCDASALTAHHTVLQGYTFLFECSCIPSTHWEKRQNVSEKKEER